MREDKIKGLTYEDINKMSNKQLLNVIESGRKYIESKLFGSKSKRGSLEVLADRILKNPSYPIPIAFQKGFDYSEIRQYRILGKTKWKERERIRNENAEAREVNKKVINQWIDTQKERFKHDTELSEKSAISQLRHEATEVRNDLRLKTITDAGWNEVVQGMINLIEEKTHIEIPKSRYKEFFQIINEVDFQATSQEENYEFWRAVAETQHDFSGKSLEYLIAYVKNNLNDLMKDVKIRKKQEDTEQNKGENKNRYVAGRNKVILPKRD